MYADEGRECRAVASKSDDERKAFSSLSVDE